MPSASWVACECDRTPCICYGPVPRIGPADPAEARRLQRDMAASRRESSAWFDAYLQDHGTELAAALMRPTEELIQEALEARQMEGSGNA